MSVGREGPPDHKCLLGQEVLAVRSDGNWHEAIITDVHVQFPDVCCWNKFAQDNYVKVTFADGMTATIKTNVKTTELIGPVADPHALVKRRCKELFERHRKQEAEGLPRSEVSTAGTSSPNKRKAEDDSNRRTVVPRPHVVLDKKLSVPQTQHERPSCMDSDSDADDEILSKACAIAEQHAATVGAVASK